MSAPTIQKQFGQIDIYLFDQLLKGRISAGMRILDTGCGSGRNLVYFLREGYEVYAVDQDAQAVESVRALARMFAPALRESNFRVESVEHMSFDRLLLSQNPGLKSLSWWLDGKFSSSRVGFAAIGEGLRRTLPLLLIKGAPGDQGKLWKGSRPTGRDGPRYDLYDSGGWWATKLTPAVVEQ
jgi:SAM-dependent methyltransferase